MLIFSGGFSSCSDSYCCHTVPAAPEKQGGCDTLSPSLGWRVCPSPSCHGSGTTGAPSQGDILSHSRLWQRQRLNPGSQIPLWSCTTTRKSPRIRLPASAGLPPAAGAPLFGELQWECVQWVQITALSRDSPRASAARQRLLLTCPKYLSPGAPWPGAGLGWVTPLQG